MFLSAVTMPVRASVQTGEPLTSPVRAIRSAGGNPSCGVAPRLGASPVRDHAPRGARVSRLWPQVFRYLLRKAGKSGATHDRSCLWKTESSHHIMSTPPSITTPTRIVTMGRAEFAERFGCPDVGECFAAIPARMIRGRC